MYNTYTKIAQQDTPENEVKIPSLLFQPKSAMERGFPVQKKVLLTAAADRSSSRNGISYGMRISP